MELLDHNIMAFIYYQLNPYFLPTQNHCALGAAKDAVKTIWQGTLWKVSDKVRYENYLTMSKKVSLD